MGKLNLVSDFLQEIVVRAVPFRPPQSKGNLALVPRAHLRRDGPEPRLRPTGDRICSVRRIVGRMDPRQAFLGKKLLRRREPRCVFVGKRADMKLNFRQAFPFARHGGPAARAESAQPAGRRIELGYLSLCHVISVTSERDEGRNGAARMPAAALAMAPRHLRRFTPGDKSHRAAQTPALDLIAHVGFPPSEMLRTGY
jgi:hypothetical protein